MALENLKSIFQDELLEKTELFQSNQPVDRFDTKFNYNENSIVLQTHGFDVDINPPILDSVLRGRVYEPIQFSQDITERNFFVLPESGFAEQQLYKTQTFDPRATTPKQGTLYFNTGNTFKEATNPTDFSEAGFNNQPYTPLQGLYSGEENNLDPQINMSWQSLYITQHRNKENPGWKGLTPVNYGSIVNRDKLNIKFNTNTLRDGIIREPYIVSNIPRTSSDISSGRTVNFGSRDFPINRLLIDSIRVGSFLTSPAGVLFLVKQNLLGANTKSVFVSKDGKLQSSKQRFKSTLNPLSLGNQTLFRAGGAPLSLMDRSEPDLSTLGGGSILPDFQDFLKSPEYGGSDTIPYNIDDTFNGGSSTNESNENAFKRFKKSIENQVKSALGEVTDIKDKSSGGDKITLSSMIKGAELSEGASRSIELFGEEVYREEMGFGAGQKGSEVFGDASYTELGVNPEEEKNGMPFYFKDLRDSTYIFFRAYIEGLTENISPSYASHNYMGRSEPVYTYERGEREISFTLKLAAQTRDELIAIYKKMDRLTSMCYPQYVDEGESGYGNRMKPPLAKLRYGELFGSMNKELMGYIKSISYAVDQTSPYETDPKTGRVPRFVNATIGYQVIHDRAPRLGTKFYGMVEERVSTRQETSEEAPATGEGTDVNTDFGGFV